MVNYATIHYCTKRHQKTLLCFRPILNETISEKISFLKITKKANGRLDFLYGKKMERKELI